MSGMVLAPPEKGKGRSSMAVMRDRHGPRQVGVDNGCMADDDNVLAFPQAPEAIELRHLRAFVAVAEDLNFGRPPNASTSPARADRQIRSLEQLLGCELLRPRRIAWS